VFLRPGLTRPGRAGGPRASGKSLGRVLGTVTSGCVTELGSAQPQRTAGPDAGVQMVSRWGGQRLLADLLLPLGGSARGWRLQLSVPPGRQARSSRPARKNDLLTELAGPVFRMVRAESV